MEAIHRDAFFSSQWPCAYFLWPVLEERAGQKKNSSHQELGLKEERNSTEHKKERGKAEGAKQAKGSKTANVLTASRTKVFSDVFLNKAKKDSLAMWETPRLLPASPRQNRDAILTFTTERFPTTFWATAWPWCPLNAPGSPSESCSGQLVPHRCVSAKDNPGNNNAFVCAEGLIGCLLGD